MPAQLNENIILAAIEGFESQKTKIDQQVAELRALLSGRSPARADSSEAGLRRRRFSAEAIKRMREAQQRRWAKVRGEAPAAAATAETAKPKKGRLSAAGRKAISEATKLRWALKRAEAAKTAATKAAPAKKKTVAKKAVRKSSATVKKAAAKSAPAPAPASTQNAG